MFDVSYNETLGHKRVMQEESKFLNGFVGSILVHVAIIILLFILPVPKPAEAPLKFEILETPQNKTRPSQQVIRQNQVPDNMLTKEEQDRLRFFSDKTQRVKEELKARLSGLTQNRSNNPNSPQKEQAPQQAVKNIPKPKELDTNGFEKFLPQREMTPARQAVKNQERGFSTLSEDLPNEIHVGDITAVDTDHYLFYSYFSRAQELLWNEWAPMIQSVLSNPPPSIKSGSQNRFTTVLEAWFYPDGKLHSVHLLKPAGAPELDYIASTSFKRVGIIPNPPREKIDPDGIIRFKWSLSVEYNPKVLVRQ